MTVGAALTQIRGDLHERVACEAGPWIEAGSL